MVRPRGVVLPLGTALIWLAFSRHVGTPFLSPRRHLRSRGCIPRSARGGRAGDYVPSWDSLLEKLPSSNVAEPLVIDSALNPAKPTLDGLTLFRERHGWCPYSERVWLALEAKGLEYSTVLIDNTGPERKPPWWGGGNTPQILWESGRQQGESMDIVRQLDAEYPETAPLWPDEEVTRLVDAFQKIFPKGTRPSSRAAFLFKGYGDMTVWRSEFEETLTKTNKLLGEHGDGPFFYGDKFTAADIAWAPFLERYCEQLPCLHAGLEPHDPERWPNLAAWYSAMMQRIPAYGGRVRGDSVSWRRVLSMAGYGNSGAAPVLESPDTSRALRTEDDGDWAAFAASRPHVADTPGEEAAARVVRNRVAIVADAVKRGSLVAEEADGALRGLAMLLAGLGDEAECSDAVVAAADYLDERLCVPRDMGLLPARVVRGLAERLRERPR